MLLCTHGEGSNPGLKYGATVNRVKRKPARRRIRKGVRYTASRRTPTQVEVSLVQAGKNDEQVEERRPRNVAQSCSSARGGGEESPRRSWGERWLHSSTSRGPSRTRRDLPPPKVGWSSPTVASAGRRRRCRGTTSDGCAGPGSKKGWRPREHPRARVSSRRAGDRSRSRGGPRRACAARSQSP